MATEYDLKLKATLDTTQVDSKVKALEAQSSGGNGSSSSFGSLENAIKKLNMSIDKLTNASNKPTSGVAAQTDGSSSIQNPQLKAMLRFAAGHYLGGQLTRMGSEQVRAGNNGFGMAAGTVGGLLQGAMAGAGFGPFGVVAGAAVGGLSQAMNTLTDASKNATEQLMKQVEVQQKQIKRWHEAKTAVELNKEIREFSGMTDEELIRITKELPAAKNTLEEFTTGVAGRNWAEANKEVQDLEAPQTVWQTFLRDIGWTKQENRTEKNFLTKRDEKLAELQENIVKAGIRAEAAQEILNKRGMISIYGTRGEKASYTSLTGLLGTTSSQANMGYDVGGYGGFASIEQNQLAKQVEIAKSSQTIADTVKQTHVITTNLYSLLMNRFMGLNGGNKATWGGN